MRFPLVAIAALALASSAHGQALPRYTPAKMCGYALGSNVMFNGCLEQEQRSYDLLQPLWRALSARGRAFCLNYTQQYHQPTYTYLRACARGQYGLDRQSAPKETFRY